jgi:hypothetical protein
MNRLVLLLVLMLALAFTFAGPSANTSAEDVQWTLKYQILSPRYYVFETTVTKPNPDNPDVPLVEVVKKKYWYQVMYFKNPLKEKVTVPFGNILLVDTVKTVRDPETGETINVTDLLPAFKGQEPNYVVSEKTGKRITIPGTAFNPVYDPIIRAKIIADINIKPYRTQQFQSSFQNELITERALDKYYDYVDLAAAFEPEEVRQVILLYKDLDEGFDSLVFRFSGLTNEYIFATEEDKLAGKGHKKVLKIEYTRPGDEFDTEDTNPEPVDLFHLEGNEWILEAIG